MHHFRYAPDGHLSAEDVDLEKIARDVGTPTYVYSRATIERHYRVFDEAFAGHAHTVCFAVKANANVAVLKTMARLGSGADIVSGGELHRALRAGIPADRIVFSGVGKTAEQMSAALDADILAFNVESEPELLTLSRVAAEKGRVARVALRVNPDIDAKTHPYISTGLRESKFGIPIADAARIAELAARLPSLQIVGVGCHIGSQLTSLPPMLEALDALLRLVGELSAAGHDIVSIDLGGGLGIPYDVRKEEPPLPREFGAGVVARLSGVRQRLILEPGRVIVGNAGILLVRVLYVKSTGDRTFVIVDGAMNDLLRPSLYQAHHEILPVCARDGQPVAVDVVGPICESADAFARQRALPPVEAGDLLAVMSAGAYGFSMASTYNSRPRAAEVMVDGGAFHIVRARESIEALSSTESIPSWLAE